MKHFELSGRMEITLCCETKSAVLSITWLLEIIVPSEGVWVPLYHKKFQHWSSVNRTQNNDAKQMPTDVHNLSKGNQSVLEGWHDA